MTFRLLLLFLAIISTQSYAVYPNGCQDPKYQAYIDKRFAFFAQNNQRMYDQTLSEYEHLVTTESSRFSIISALTRHLIYSAQVDPIATVQQKINDLLAYSDSLSMEQRIAGLVLDEFSSENHAINMARAWISYRKGDIDTARVSLMASLNINNSMLLSAFGPDFSLVRHLYKDGHIDIVKAFIQKTERFWQTSQAHQLRFIWSQMMILQCPIQFESGDSVQAMNLGIRRHR